MIIKSNTLKAALLFVPAKDIRYYLKSVCLSQGEQGSFLAATDGSALFVSQVCKEPMPESQTLIPPELANAALKGAATNLLLEVTPIQDKTTKMVKLGAMTQESVDGLFPDWRRITRMTGNICSPQFNSQYVATIYKAGKLLTKNTVFVNPQPGIGVAVLDETSAVWLMPMAEKFVEKTFNLPSWIS